MGLRGVEPELRKGATAAAGRQNSGKDVGLRGVEPELRKGAMAAAGRQKPGKDVGFRGVEPELRRGAMAAAGVGGRGCGSVTLRGVLELDAATVLLQWATGGMLFCWFTTRRREVGLGYGWLLRGTFGLLAIGALALGLRFGVVLGRELASAGVAIACAVALGVSIARRRAGVSGQRAEHDRRTARIAAMTGIERTGRGDTSDTGDAAAGGAGGRTTDDAPGTAGVGGAGDADSVRTAFARSRGAAERPVREFPPVLDLVPVVIGAIGLLVAADAATGEGGAPLWVSIARTLVGAAFLGALSASMLLGHWYLVQPGLPRRLLNEIVMAVALLWPFQVAVMLVPPGMISVFTGTIDDGWGGVLGWMWLACAATTIVLVLMTRAALKERQYSAVMAATGLLYLAILTGFGTDLVARAVLSG